MASPVKRRIPAHPSRPGAQANRAPDTVDPAKASPSGSFTGDQGQGVYDNAVDLASAEKYESTAYGPPWGGIQGTGVTAGGTNLKDGHQAYIVAADPAKLPLGTEVYIHPNPFGYKGRFLVDDTGGAIKGNRIDFYDWRGRGSQRAWGRRTVEVVKVKGGRFDTQPNPFAQAAGNIGDALGVGDPLAAFKELAKMFMALFYPGTWVRIGKVVGGFLLVMWGVHALLKASFGVDVVKGAKSAATKVAVAAAIK